MKRNLYVHLGLYGLGLPINFWECRFSSYTYKRTVPPWGNLGLTGPLRSQLYAPLEAIPIHDASGGACYQMLVTFLRNDVSL